MAPRNQKQKPAQKGKAKAAPVAGSAAPAAKKGVVGAAVGIDFGSSTVTLAAYKNGLFEAIVNTDGERFTPLIAGYNGQELFLGSPAKAIAMKGAEYSVASILPFLAKPFDQLTDQEKGLVKCPLVKLENGLTGFEIAVEGATKVISPDELITAFSQQLFVYAQQYWDGAMSSAVVSVPQNITAEASASLVAAVEAAGFQVLATVQEPIAAALSFHFDQPHFTCNASRRHTPFADSPLAVNNALIIDVGQNSVKTSLLSIQHGFIKHIGTSVTEGGASAIDSLLFEYFANEFKNETDLDLHSSARAVNRLKQACDQVKRSIGVSASAGVQLDGLYQGEDLFTDITKLKFDKITDDFFASIQKQLVALFEQYANVITPKDITSVVFAGGAAALARFTTVVNKFFASANVKPELLKHVNICDTVAFGAAKLAFLLAKEVATLPQEDITNDVHHVTKYQHEHITSTKPAAAPVSNVNFASYQNHSHLSLSKALYVKTFHNTYVSALPITTAAPSSTYVPFVLPHPRHLLAAQPTTTALVTVVESGAHLPQHVTEDNSRVVATFALDRAAILAAATEKDLDVTAVLAFELSELFQLTLNVAYHVKGQAVPQWNELASVSLLEQKPVLAQNLADVLPAPTLQNLQHDDVERLTAKVQYLVSRYEQWKALPKHQKYIAKNAYFKPIIADVDQFVATNFAKFVALPNPYNAQHLDEKFSVVAVENNVNTATVRAQLDTFAEKLHQVLRFRKLTAQEAAVEVRRLGQSAAPQTKQAPLANPEDDDELDIDIDLDLDDDDDELDDDFDLDDLDVDVDDLDE